MNKKLISKCWCGHTGFTVLFGVSDYEIAQCAACDTVRTLYLKKTPHLQVYRQQDTNIYLKKEQQFRQTFTKIIKFIQKYKSTGNLVDVGAGVGLLVDEAQKAGFKAIGFEPSKAMMRAGQGLGIKLFRHYFSSKLINSAVDIVIVNHVLEHTKNPAALLKDINQILQPGSLLVIGLPNFASLMSKIKQERWQSLSPEQHRWHFTLRTLDQLVIPYGFIRLGLSTENHDRSRIPWWKLPIYWILDTIALATKRGEAILVIYRKIC